VRATVGISDTEETLGDHVEVEIDEKIVDVLGGQVGCVELASQKAVLLGSPPGETDLVLGLVLGKSEEELKDQRRTGTWEC
jgi:hypothetical protein